MIKAITFDLWNTLFDNISYSEERLNLLSLWMETYKPNYEISELKKYYNDYFSFTNPEFKILKEHHVYTKDRLKKLVNAFNINPSLKDINHIVEKLESVMLKNPPPLKFGVKDTVSILARKYKLGIISDTGVTPGRIIREILGQYDILKHFNTTIFSDETGYYKPHPIAFKSALDNLGVTPRHTIHIGDLLETDIKGAKNFNMHAILLKDHSQINYNTIQPDFEIDEISEVIEIIEKL